MGGEEVGKMNISNYQNAWDSQGEEKVGQYLQGEDMEGGFYLI